MGVRHRLERDEGFRRNNEERISRIEIADCFHEIGSVDIRNEAERHRAIAVMLQGLIRHHRPEIGAANSDVDDVAYAISGVTLPGATPDTVAEVCHFVEHVVDIGLDILTVDNDSCLSWCPQRYVKDGPV